MKRNKILQKKDTCGSYVLTSNMMPFRGNTCISGLSAGMNRKNSNSSLYHLTL